MGGEKRMKKKEANKVYAGAISRTNGVARATPRDCTGPDTSARDTRTIISRAIFFFSSFSFFTLFIVFFSARPL